MHHSLKTLIGASLLALSFASPVLLPSPATLPSRNTAPASPAA